MFVPNANALEEVDVNGSMYKYNVIETNSINPDLMAVYADTLPAKENLNLSVDIETKLRDISDKQKLGTDEINKIINEINNSSQVKVFIIGNNLGLLKFQLVQINNYIFQLIDLIQMPKDGPNLAQLVEINNQMKILKDVQIKAENFVLKQEHKFSLFGWFIFLL